jgi:hypothetical protein
VAVILKLTHLAPTAACIQCTPKIVLGFSLHLTVAQLCDMRSVDYILVEPNIVVVVRFPEICFHIHCEMETAGKYILSLGLNIRPV